MTAAVLTIIALPIVVALTLRFTSWAEQNVLGEEPAREERSAANRIPPTWPR